jgi:hypothetical protein
MRIINRPAPAKAEALLARHPMADQLLASHPARYLFDLVLLEVDFDRVSLLADLKDKSLVSAGDYKGTLGLVVDLAARMAGTGLLGASELVEYELHHYQGPQLASLKVEASVELPSPGFAICQCAISTCGDLEEYRVASAQGTLVRSASGTRPLSQ